MHTPTCPCDHSDRVVAVVVLPSTLQPLVPLPGSTPTQPQRPTHCSWRTPSGLAAHSVLDRLIGQPTTNLSLCRRNHSYAEELEARLQLQRWHTDPAATSEWLKQGLGLSFDDQPVRGYELNHAFMRKLEMYVTCEGPGASGG